MSPQDAVTTAIAANGPSTARQISDAAGIPLTTLRRMLADLETNGLLTRTRGSGSARGRQPDIWHYPHQPVHPGAHDSEAGNGPDHGGKGRIGHAQPAADDAAAIGDPSDGETCPRDATPAPHAEGSAPDSVCRIDDAAGADPSERPQSDTPPSVKPERSPAKPPAVESPNGRRPGDASGDPTGTGPEASERATPGDAPGDAAGNAGEDRQDPAQDSANGKPPVPASGSARRKPGQLRALVYSYVQAQPGQEFTAGQIARALSGSTGRNVSTGAVTNALTRLAGEGKAVRVGERPERFTATGEPAHRPDPAGDT